MTFTEERSSKQDPNNPHGLGDPKDRRLRKVEKDILIKKKVREIAKERCSDFILDFKKCCREHGSLLIPFVCKKENEAHIKCMEKWFYDKELNDQMTKEYLEERSYYRLNGVPKKKKENGTHGQQSTKEI